MNWRDIKDAARAKVHETFLQEATITRLDGSQYGVNVRVLRRDVSFGNYDGIGYADLADAPVEIVFLVEEMPDPQVGDLITLVTGEEYRLNQILPTDGITVKADAKVE